MIDTLIVTAVKQLINSIVTETIFIILLFIFLIIRVLNLLLIIFGFTSLSMMIDNDILTLFALLVGR